MVGGVLSRLTIPFLVHTCRNSFTAEQWSGPRCARERTSVIPVWPANGSGPESTAGDHPSWPRNEQFLGACSLGPRSYHQGRPDRSPPGRGAADRPNRSEGRACRPGADAADSRDRVPHDEARLRFHRNRDVTQTVAVRRDRASARGESPGRSLHSPRCGAESGNAGRSRSAPCARISLRPRLR